jgi:hypothetical protein
VVVTLPATTASCEAGAGSDEEEAASTAEATRWRLPAKKEAGKFTIDARGRCRKKIAQL